MMEELGFNIYKISGKEAFQGRMGKSFIYNSYASVRAHGSEEGARGRGNCAIY